MNKLIVSGDSYTFGHGLVDCWRENLDLPGTKPSRFAWPSILASKLQVKNVNLARPGQGNNGIIYGLLDANLKPKDEVVVLWSFLTRRTHFNPNTIFNAGEWTPSLLPFLEKFSSNSDLVINNLIDIHNITVYLETKKVHIHYMFIDPLLEVEVDRMYLNFYRKLIKRIVKYDITKKTYEPIQIRFARGQYKKALDDSHPGEDWHRDLGVKIYDEVFKTRPEFTDTGTNSLI